MSAPASTRLPMPVDLPRSPCCNARVDVGPSSVYRNEVWAACSECEQDMPITPEQATWARAGIQSTELLHKGPAERYWAIRKALGLSC